MYQGFSNSHFLPYHRSLKTERSIKSFLPNVAVFPVYIAHVGISAAFPSVSSTTYCTLSPPTTAHGYAHYYAGTIPIEEAKNYTRVVKLDSSSRLKIAWSIWVSLCSMVSCVRTTGCLGILNALSQ